MNRRFYHQTTVGRAVSWIALILKLKHKNGYYKLIINKERDFKCQKNVLLGR